MNALAGGVPTWCPPRTYWTLFNDRDSWLDKVGQREIKTVTAEERQRSTRASPSAAKYLLHPPRNLYGRDHKEVLLEPRVMKNWSMCFISHLHSYVSYVWIETWPRWRLTGISDLGTSSACVSAFWYRMADMEWREMVGTSCVKRQNVTGCE